MDLPMRKMVLSNYQSVTKEDHNDLEAYKHTSVLQPRMTMDKLIKDRAIGGTTKSWNKAQKRMYERRYGPNTFRPFDIIPVPTNASPIPPQIIINNQIQPTTVPVEPGRVQDPPPQVSVASTELKPGRAIDPQPNELEAEAVQQAQSSTQPPTGNLPYPRSRIFEGKGPFSEIFPLLFSYKNNRWLNFFFACGAKINLYCLVCATKTNLFLL